MSRYRTYGDVDDKPYLDGDRGLRGINMRMDPALLDPGLASEAKNARFRYGVAETRKGHMVMPWANKTSAGNIYPWPNIYGQGIFDDPRTFQQFCLIASNGNVYYTVEENTPVQLSLPPGISITEPVTFTQAFDKVLMHRGPGKPTLVMHTLGAGFEYITQTERGIGVLQIPDAERGLFLQNRVWIPNDQDEIAFSDIGDYTRYSINQEFRINQGSSDRLLNVAKFNDKTLIAFKENSIVALLNVYGDMSLVEQDELTAEYGLVAPESIAHVGSDLWFLSQWGVMSIRQSEENKLKCVVLPKSEPIQPLIDRINWKYAHKASAAYWNSRYYLAVPLDRGEVLGDDLVESGVEAWPEIAIQVEQGAEYRWEQATSQPGSSATKIVNGTDTYYSSCDFIAQGTDIRLRVIGIPNPNQKYYDSVYRVFKGVNNAILVYDFYNNEWSGYDESPGTDFAKLFVLRHQHRRRLFSYSSEGWMILHEEAYRDQIPRPYVNVNWIKDPEEFEVDDPSDVDTTNDRVTCNATHGVPAITNVLDARICAVSSTVTLPNPLTTDTVYYLHRVDDTKLSFHTSAQGAVDGTTDLIDLTTQGSGILRIHDIVQVSSGTIVKAHDAADNQAGGFWSAQYPQFLWRNSSSHIGYDPVCDTEVWTAPNTTKIRIIDGIRFVSDNGILPAVSAGGNWYTVECVNKRQIDFLLVTRAYEAAARMWTKWGYFHIDLQTWNPKTSLTVMRPGVLEETLILEEETRDPAKYYRPHNKADWQIDNANDDFETKQREDYSVVLNIPNVSYGLCLKDGIRLSYHQERRISKRISEQDRYIRVKIENSQGRVRMMGINIEGAPTPENERMKT